MENELIYTLFQILEAYVFRSFTENTAKQVIAASANVNTATQNADDITPGPTSESDKNKEQQQPNAGQAQNQIIPDLTVGITDGHKKTYKAISGVWKLIARTLDYHAYYVKSLKEFRECLHPIIAKENHTPELIRAFEFLNTDFLAHIRETTILPIQFDFGVNHNVSSMPHGRS